MKLQTEIKNRCVHASGFCVTEDAVEYRQAEKLVYDASAAHAMKQAIETTCGRNTEGMIMEMAENLMREWGF